MRTEADLREALAARAVMAPGPEPVLAGVDGAVGRHRRRTMAAVAAATIAVVAAITVPALVVQGGPETAGPGDTAAGDPPMGIEPGAPPVFDPADHEWEPFTFMINPEAAGSHVLVPLAAGPDHQLAELTPVGADEPVAGLVIYRPGAESRVDWDVAPDPTTTKVGSAPAWFSTQDGKVSALRWEYAPGAYAVLTSPYGESTSPPLGENALRELAASVVLQFVAPYPVTVPYRLDYLPAGMTPFNVVQNLGDAPRSTVQLESGDGVMDISIGEDWQGANPDWDWQDTTIAGHPARCADLVDGRRCDVELDGVTIGLGAGDLSDDELAQIVAGMTLAVWDDPATWYPLEDALPAN